MSYSNKAKINTKKRKKKRRENYSILFYVNQLYLKIKGIERSNEKGEE